jgi:hypothetical protein
MLSKNIAEMIELTEQHIAADAVRGGHYWEESDNAVGGTGCFIACLTHGSKAEDVTDKFGLPEPSVKIIEDIFEALPEEEKPKFFLDIPNAIGKDGKDLSKIHWKFLASELRALPDQKPDIKKVIDPVIEGMDLLSNGKEWPDAAYAAYAAYGFSGSVVSVASYAAARAAESDGVGVGVGIYAARAAADAAAYASRAAARSAGADGAREVEAEAEAEAEAAYAAARKRQASTIIELLKSA